MSLSRHNDAVLCIVGQWSAVVRTLDSEGTAWDLGAFGEFEVFNSFQPVLCAAESILFAEDAIFYQVL